MSLLDESHNADGTYNGAKFMASLFGLDEREVTWTANRMKQLMVVQRKTGDEAKAIVKEELKEKPWLK